MVCGFAAPSRWEPLPLLLLTAWKGRAPCREDLSLPKPAGRISCLVSGAERAVTFVLGLVGPASSGLSIF